MRRLLVFLLASASLTAQQQQTAPPNRARGPQGPVGTITGHVLCTDTNAPARLARVTLQQLPDFNATTGAFGIMPGGGGGMATTDFDGAFTMINVRPGTYAFRVQYDGYVDPMSNINVSQWMSRDPQIQQQIRSQLTTVTINGNDSASADLRVERGGTIAGQVLYDDGSPASGLNVTVRDANAQMTPRTPGSPIPAVRMLPTSGGRTDDRGQFRISSLPPGEYNVSAIVNIPHVFPANADGSMSRTTFSIETVYAPNAFHKKDAQVIKIGHADSVNGISITMPTRGLRTVSGTVAQQANGMPVGGGNIRLEDPDDPSLSLNGQILRDGSFRVELVPPGSYVLRVTTAFDAVDNTGPGPQNRPSHYYGPAQMSLTITTGDMTGLTVQVPALDDPSRPPRMNGPLSSTTVRN